ncbi:MAG: MFS transporter [Candidatus Odyssella sp.]|nr:MFS transporter [Candidatus Odyssella sp.]
MSSKDPSSHAPLAEREVLTIIAGVLLAVFLASLDQTIVATALPTIAAEFQDVDHLSWIMSGYLLAATISTPIYGKLGDLYGRRTLLTTAIAFFVVASVLSALAGSMGHLVAARAIQGVGAGGLMTLAQAIIGETVAPRERGRYQGYFAAVFAASSVGGPIVGGIFVDYLSWRWIFWINVPLGLAALALCHFALRRLPVHRHRARIDYAGALLLTLGVGALMLVLAWGGNLFAWASPEIFGLAALSLAALAVFAWWERRAPEPLLPLHLFANPVFRSAGGIIFFAAMAMMGSVAFLPLYLQLAAGATASSAGLLLIPMTLGIVGGSTLSGRVMMRTGRYKFLPIVGMALAALGYGAFAFTAAAYSETLHVGVMAAIGAGIGMVFPVVTISVQNAVPARNLGVATSANGLARMLGGAIGVAILGAVLAGSLEVMMQKLGGARFGGAATLAALPPAQRSQLLAMAESTYAAMFYACAAMTLLALVAALLMKELPLRTTAHRGAAPGGE